MKMRRILWLALALCLLSALLPAAVYASGSAALQVAREDGGAVSCADGVWLLEDGGYTVRGTARDFERVRIAGDVTLTLDGASILHTTSEAARFAPAVEVEAGGRVTLILSGENSLAGSPGHAGLYVAEGASLTICGDGSLTVVGGAYYLDQSDRANPVSCAAGAGIGGNGLTADRTGAKLERPNFGTIRIEGGTVRAVGGANTQINYGAGAGIGAGGGSSMWSLDPVFTGRVELAGGTVTAVGGDGDSFSLTGGGAGIGTGGVTGNFWAPFPNEICVSISGGTVDAAGTADGAGIGGGANVNGGVIEITARQPEAVEGFCFDGWYVDEGCTEKFADGTVLDEDTVLYGRWLPKLTPVLPQAAAYRVEHYLEQPDGSYALEETEFPLYGAVGQTVTAVPKQWAGRHVNEARSVLAGTVVLPVAENGTVQVLVLRVYYDLDDDGTDSAEPSQATPSQATPSQATPSQATPSSDVPASDTPSTGDAGSTALLSAVVLAGAAALVVVRRRV